jgi:lipoprotein-releasing system permease protein
MHFAWDLFRHYLLSRRAGALIRTVAWLCMIGVGLGVMALVVVISVMNGFNDSIRKRLLAVEPHLVVQVPGVTTASALTEHPLYEELTRRAGVQVEIFETQDVILRTVDGLFGGAIAKGIDPEALGYILQNIQRAIMSSNPRQAEEFKAAGMDVDDPLDSGEILVGIDLARSLGIFEGDRVTVIPPEALLLPPGEAPPFERATVKGLLTTNIQDIDSRVVFFGRGSTFNSFRRSASREVGLELRIPDPEQVGPLQAELQSRGMTVATWIERNSAIFYALKMEKMAMGVFLGLSALIASFSIVTVLVLLLTQKRKDIGVLMSMGLSPNKTRWLFVRVGLMLSSIGILSGLVVGVAICLVIDRYPIPILPNIYYDATIPATVDPRFIFGILVVSGLIAFLSADLPARAVTGEMPAEALSGKKNQKSRS